MSVWDVFSAEHYREQEHRRHQWEQIRELREINHHLSASREAVAHASAPSPTIDTSSIESALDAIRSVGRQTLDAMRHVSEQIAGTTVALDSIADILRHPEGTRSSELQRRGVECLRQGWLDEALTALRDAAGHDPVNHRTHFLLGLTQLQRDEPADAVDAFVLATRYARDDHAVSASAYLLRSAALTGLGRTDDALATLREGAGALPDCAELLVAYAEREHDPAAASRAATRVLAVAPEYAVVVSRLRTVPQAADLAARQVGPAVAAMRAVRDAVQALGGEAPAVLLDLPSDPLQAASRYGSWLAAAETYLATNRRADATAEANDRVTVDRQLASDETRSRETARQLAKRRLPMLAWSVISLAMIALTAWVLTSTYDEWQTEKIAHPEQSAHWLPMVIIGGPLAFGTLVVLSSWSGAMSRYRTAVRAHVSAASAHADTGSTRDDQERARLATATRLSQRRPHLAAIDDAIRSSRPARRLYAETVDYAAVSLGVLPLSSGHTG